MREHIDEVEHQHVEFVVLEHPEVLHQLLACSAVIHLGVGEVYLAAIAVEERLDERCLVQVLALLAFLVDPQVRAIREALDAAGFTGTPIMSYAVKYASAFYGPFREAADSAPSFGDRKSYQMDFHNRREGIKEALLDAEEGADILMVKPAMSYLDIVREVKDATNLPLATYSVSGEYAMVKAASSKGWIDEDRIVCEMAASAFRAGADLYITYFAKELARFIQEGRIG